MSASEEEFSRYCFSQPAPQFCDSEGNKEKFEKDDDDLYSNKIVCFSQPVHIDDLLLSSQLHSTQTAALDGYQNLIRRMTRFFVTVDAETAIKKVVDVLESSACSWKRGPPFILTFTTIDRRKNNLIFKTSVVEMNGKVLLDFRLSRGCGLEFKKLFLLVKEKLEDILLKGGVKLKI